MNYKEILKNKTNELINPINSKYNIYRNKIQVLEEVLQSLENNQKLENIDEILSDFSPSEKEDIRKIYEFYYSPLATNVIKTDTKLILNKLLSDLKTTLDSSITPQREKLENIFTIINNGTLKENIEIIKYFVDICYESKMITAEDVINIVAGIYQENDYQDTLNPTSVESDELLENEEELTDEELKILFDKYYLGLYDNKLMKKEKDKLKKYAKLKYIEHILSALKNYEIDIETVSDCQKKIIDIMICNEQAAFDKIINFVNDNKEDSNGKELFIILLQTMPSVFHSRKRKYMPRKRKDDSSGGNPPKSEEIIGCSENFQNVIEKYKELIGKDKTYKITIADIKNHTTFFQTPIEKINANIEILNNYGIKIDLISQSHVLQESTITKTIGLIGKNTKFILDRAIEAGILPVILKNPSHLAASDFKFRWYKIKRAINLEPNKSPEEVVSRNGGIKQELTKDANDYLGISYTTEDGGQKIIQNMSSMSLNGHLMDALVKGEKYLPDFKQKYIKRSNYDEDIQADIIASEEYGLYYEYKTFTPQLILDRFRKKDETFEFPADLLSLILNFYYTSGLNYSNDAELDDFIEKFDNCFKATEKTKSPEYIRNLTYEFPTLDKRFPYSTVKISKPKVIKLLKILKNNGLWFNSNDKEYNKFLLLSVLTKDTILSEQEFQILNQNINEFFKQKAKNRGV